MPEAPFTTERDDTLTWSTSGHPAAAPVLLLHGAACGAWVWDQGFGARLAAAGHPVLAITFARRNGKASLAEFTDQARAALASLPGPAVVVGHSLGGLIAQRLLGDPMLRAAALLAPVPPEGLWWSAARLAVAEPGLWSAVTHMTDPPGTTPPHIAPALFGPGMPAQRALPLLARLGGESSVALMEAQALQAIMPAWMTGKPVMVLGATGDRMIPADAVARCAAWHGVVPQMLPDPGHLLMLDEAWEAAADHLLAWLARV